MDMWIWIIDKVFILLILWIGMKAFDKRTRLLINDVITWWANPNKKKPSLKDAAGMVAFEVAKQAGPELGAWAKDGIRNMRGGNQIG